MGPATVVSSTICSFKLPVTVAKWDDLSVVFQKGRFAMLVYNYLGWPVSQRPYPPLPPVGVALTPIVTTEYGATVGDSAAKLVSLDPRLRGDGGSSYTANAFYTFVMVKRAGAVGSTSSTYFVSQIQLALGNC